MTARECTRQAEVHRPLQLATGRVAVLALALAILAAAAPARAFVAFESGQVRPLALSPDGSRLFAVNTPDDRLEVFAVEASGLRHDFSVPVGLEPVAVAARSDDEVWVVNHLSDSVSVVALTGDAGRVVSTLFVGDEPRDVVFAGPDRSRAFVTAARRGQNRPGDAQLTTPGVGRADVWVFDADDRGSGPGGEPLAIVTLFGDTPRALAVSPDGGVVYAAVFHSGNRTTIVGEDLVCDGGAAAPSCDVAGTTVPGGLPAPNVNSAGVPGPETGLIVQQDATGSWRDGEGRAWDDAVRFSLPDLDVFAIDAATLAVIDDHAHVGTILFNMAVNPANGRVYVSNTEARNEVRFEGPGDLAGTTVRGRLHESRITVLGTGDPLPRHLNKHIDYDVDPVPAGVADRSLATPVGMAVTGDGATLYVAAYGSSKVGIFSTAELEADTFVPDDADHVAVSGGGPSGVALDEARGRLYVLTRFDDSISVVDLATRTETQHVALHNPEPASVIAGRPFLFDARLTSANGEGSCASCHVFADLDSLGWDLGNPDAPVVRNPNPIHFGVYRDLHPLKGPMTTQSLRGLNTRGPMHWRGDRSGGFDVGGNPLSQSQAFQKFIIAFEDLLGREAPIAASDMQKLGDFVLQIQYPPNPIRALDNALTPAQQRGRDLYFGRVTDEAFNCNGCHTLSRSNGFFGTDGQTSEQGGPQLFKIPHLRNLYQKVGMFGRPRTPDFADGDDASVGPQVRGFGFQHDGSVDTLARFHGFSVFTMTPAERADLEQFLLAYDTNFFPVVGQQVTLAGADAAAGARLDLLVARAAAGECELVAKGDLAGEARGWVRLANGTMKSDRATEPATDVATLRMQALVAGQERTFTCMPPGEGTRGGIERDGDGFLDQDEIDAGSDPADAASIPGGPTPTPTPSPTPGPPADLTSVRTSVLLLRETTGRQTRRSFRFKALTGDDAAANRIVPPPRGSAADPTSAGGVVIVYGAGGSGDVATYALPAPGWKATGTARRPKGYRFKGAAGHPVASLVLAADKLVARGAGTYTLDEPSQGTVAVRVVLGAGAEAAGWCAAAPARQKGSPPSTAKTDRRGRFEGEPQSPPPEDCPDVP